MYQSPNTRILFKIIGASSVVLLAVFVVFGFLISKKEIPTTVKNSVDTVTVVKTSIVIPEEPKVVEKKYVVEEKTNPIIVIRDKVFDEKYRYDVVENEGLKTLNFYDSAGMPLVTITRVPTVKEIEKVVSDSYAVGNESVISIGGIAYIRQEVIALQGKNEVRIRTIPGSNCKKDKNCPLLVTQLQQSITPEYLAMYEEILSRVTFVESGESLVKFAGVFPHEKKFTVSAVPGSSKREIEEGIEIVHNDTVLARISVAKKQKKQEDVTTFTIGEREFMVYTTDETVLYMTHNATTYKMEVFREDGLISALSFQ